MLTENRMEWHQKKHFRSSYDAGLYSINGSTKPDNMRVMLLV